MNGKMKNYSIRIDRFWLTKPMNFVWSSSHITSSATIHSSRLCDRGSHSVSSSLQWSIIQFSWQISFIYFRINWDSKFIFTIFFFVWQRSRYIRCDFIVHRQQNNNTFFLLPSQLLLLFLNWFFIHDDAIRNRNIQQL